MTINELLFKNGAIKVIGEDQKFSEISTQISLAFLSWELLVIYLVM